MTDQQNPPDLNCGLKNGLLPASFSLHNVDLLPVEDLKSEPNFCCLTLRNTSNGHIFNANSSSTDTTNRSTGGPKSEICIVHGNTEVYQCIRHVLLGEKDQSLVENGSGSCHEGIWRLPFRIPLAETKTTIQGMCWILETLIQSGWEISASSMTNVTTGYDAGSYFLKKNSAPALHNAQVAAVIIDEHNGKVEVLSHRRGEKHIDINNAVQRAVRKTTSNTITTPTKSRRSTPASSTNEGRCSTDMAKEIEVELRKSQENLLLDPAASSNNSDSTSNVAKKDLPAVIKKFAKPMYNRQARDDPKCPSEFSIQSLVSHKEDQQLAHKVLNSRLVLEVAHLLFCRQWKLICHSTLPYKLPNEHIEVLYFCRDGRILPALGQQSFAMIDLEQPNLLRLYNIDEEIRDALKSAVIRIQPHLEQISDANDYSEFRWKDPVWNHVAIQNEPIEAVLIKESLTMATIGKMMMVMNKHELNLFGVSRMASNNQKRCQMIFRQSNVSYSRYLCLHLSGTNKLILIGGSQTETDLVRNVIKSRWPYPISRDGELFLDEKNKAWLFKLKRQPWAVSYGNKKFDRAVEIAQTLLRKSISPPKNTDSESGKSVLVFLLKELGDHGWRIQVALDILSVQKGAKGAFKQTHPYSIFLMK